MVEIIKPHPFPNLLRNQPYSENLIRAWARWQTNRHTKETPFPTRTGFEPFFYGDPNVDILEELKKIGQGVIEGIKNSYPPGFPKYTKLENVLIKGKWDPEMVEFLNASLGAILAKLLVRIRNNNTAGSHRDAIARAVENLNPSITLVDENPPKERYPVALSESSLLAKVDDTLPPDLPYQIASKLGMFGHPSVRTFLGQK